jgi:Bacterial Ig domain
VSMSRIRHRIVAIASVTALATLALPLLGSPSAIAAGGATRTARVLRSIPTHEFGVQRPQGIAYVPSEKALFVSTPTSDGHLQLTGVTPVEDAAGQVSVAVKSDPTVSQTLAYDPVEGSFNAVTSGDSLLSIAVSGDVQKDPVADPAVDAPRDSTFDPAGHWFMLDDATRSIVRVSADAGATKVDAIPLGVVGSLHPQGLAYNPADGLFYVLAGNVLYGLNASGVLSKRYLLDAPILDPRGMVFAPSADNTDPAAQQSLYVADAGNASTLGAISEATLAPAAAAAAPTALNATLVKTWNTAAYNPPSPDPCGITYISDEGKMMVSDSEVEEMTIWNHANLFKTTLAGAVQQTGDTTVKAISNEPTGVAYRASDRTLFISDDDADKISLVKPGADARWGTSDDTFSQISTKPFPNTDPEDVAYDPTTNHLFTIDGVGTEVYEISPGTNGVFDGVPTKGDDVVTHFDVGQYGEGDPEGIAIDTAHNSVLTLDHKTKKIYETTKTGTLLSTISITAASSVKAAGLGLAPASSVTGRTDYYIPDRGIDNDPQPSENDGKVYEMTTGGSDQPPSVTFTSPTTNQTVSGTVNLTANPTDDHGIQKVDFKVGSTLIGTDTSSAGGWTVPWNTANGSFPDGGYSVTATATDTANQIGTATINVNVDNVDAPPAVAITNPSNNATVSGTVSVTANPTDDRGITKVDFFVGATLIGTDTSATGGWTVPWNTTSGYPDSGSPYTVTATATDTGTHTASASISVNVDNVDDAPTVALTSPTEGQTVSGASSALSATAGDDRGVTKVEFKVDSTLVATDTTAGDGYTGTWNTTSFTSGPHTVSAIATDSGNHTTTDTKNVTVDNDGAPSVQITSPTNNSTISGASIDVTANASDDHAVTQVEFLVDGTSIGVDSDGSDGYGASWVTVGASDGPHAFKAIATDTANHTASNQVTATLDNVDDPPSVTITDPTGGTKLRGTITIKANASDDHGVDHVSFFDGGTLIGTATSPGTGGAWSVQWDTTGAADGAHTINATATDNATLPHQTSDSVNVTVDNTAPNVSITAPAAGQVSGTIPVTASASDTTTSVAKVQFFAGASSIGTDTDGSNGFSVSWNTTSASNGPLSLTAVATDAAGNTKTSDPVAVTVNNQATASVVDVPVRTIADDAEERASGSTYIDSSDLELTTDGTNVQKVGMRFTGVAVPRNATITKAYVQLTVDEVTTAATSLTVQGQASDNAATFVAGTTNNSVSSRPRTAASVAWTPAGWTTVGAHGVDQRTPELKSVIQEIVNRAGWASGNAMAVIVTGTGTRTASAFDSGASLAPVLHVEYTIP